MSWPTSGWGEALQLARARSDECEVCGLGSHDESVHDVPPDDDDDEIEAAAEEAAVDRMREARNERDHESWERYVDQL